jgi:hypothetical protein
MRELYSWNTPLALGFLVFVVLFIWKHRKSEGR